MDVKVITRHAPTNYGSLLQAIATIRIINSLGHNCKIIDYQRKDERGLQMILAALKLKPNWNKNFFTKLVYCLLRYPEESFAQRVFDIMRKKYLCMTPRYNSIESLSGLDADIYVTGSDQVWGSVITGDYDPAYFLSFANDSSKKIALASSFGKTNFSDKTIQEYREMLSRYDNITVREDVGVEMLRNMGLSCDGQILDPTLLLTAKDWSEYIISKPKLDNYILIYQLHNNPKVNHFAELLSKKTSLPLIRISPYLHQINRCGKLLYLPRLETFLSYFKYCTFLVTDSFHGTAFAINFNKNFYEILPNNNTDSRNKSILKLTGLLDRIVTDSIHCSLPLSINYDTVNNIINSEREKSINKIKSIIL